MGNMACSVEPKTNPSNRDVRLFRLASAYLISFTSRLRDQSSHNLWL
jgi:hypothetical protein